MTDDNNSAISGIIPLNYSSAENSAALWNIRAMTCFKLVSVVYIFNLLWELTGIIRMLGKIVILESLPWLLGYWFLGDIARRGSYRKTLIVTASAYMIFCIIRWCPAVLFYIREGHGLNIYALIYNIGMLAELCVWVYILRSLLKSTIITKSAVRPLLPDHDKSEMLANKPEVVEKNYYRFFWGGIAALSFWLIAAIDLFDVWVDPGRRKWWLSFDLLSKSLVLGLAGACAIKGSHLKMLILICLSMVLIGLYYTNNLSGVMLPYELAMSTFEFMLRILKLLFAIAASACLSFMLAHRFIKDRVRVLK